MRRPRVGLTLDIDAATGTYQLSRAYADAVLLAGGLPVPMAYGDDAAAGAYLALCHAVILTGGGFDVAPERYGEARRPECGPDKVERTDFEWSVCEAALEGRIPLLGICGGMQLMNVVRGGTLHQDLEADLGLPGHQGAGAEHVARIVPGTLLARVAGKDPLTVNSSHHQAVKEAGAGVLVSARSEDGVAEAIELPDLPFALGVQWHPERRAPTEPRHLAVFRALVQAAEDLRR